MMNKNTLRRLEQSEHALTRGLYEEVFPEDSKAFVDYYYKYKTAANQIYVIENEKDEIVSMLQLNPYQVKIGQNTAASEYIIAVATRSEYRHQGMMRRLLCASLEDSRRKQMPFVYLMPAAEAIYYPFDFRFIYDRPQWEIGDALPPSADSLRCTSASPGDLPQLSRWAEQLLRENCRTYPVHDQDYYRTLLEEQRCQGGEVVLIREGDAIRGCFFTTAEGGPEVREALVEEAYREEAFGLIAGWFGGASGIKIYGGNLSEGVHGYRSEPKIMARIVHAGAMFECLSAEQPIELKVHITDPILERNTGTYCLSLDENGCSAKQSAGDTCQWRLSVAQLTELIFGRIDIAATGAPAGVQQEWQKIRLPLPVMFNEVV